MSFDFGGSLDSAPGDVPSDVNVDPQSPDYGGEQITNSPTEPGDQVANQSGNSDFVNATDPSATQTAPTDISSSVDPNSPNFVGPPNPGTLDKSAAPVADPNLATAPANPGAAASGNRPPEPPTVSGLLAPLRLVWRGEL